MWHSFVLWFADIIKWMYSLTQQVGVPSYGLAIIFMTIAIKLVLFPLTQKQLKSTLAMQEIQPKARQIQERYKDNPQVMQQKTMELYKQYNINPFGGCLPLIIQMPIFIAFYQSLMLMSKTVFLHAQNPGFLWIANIGILVKADPSITKFILPVLAGLTTFYQQKISMVGGTDPTQKSMLYFMPLFMAWITYTVPAGLALYWVVFNILGILQQFYVNATHNKLKFDTGTGLALEAENGIVQSEEEPGIESKQENERNKDQEDKQDDGKAAGREKGGKKRNATANKRKKRKKR